MVTAASAKPGRVNGVEVYDLGPQVRAEASGELHADFVVRGIEHGDTSYEVRIFFNAPDADGDTARTTDAGYAGHISISGHGHHTGDDPDRPHLPIDVKIDVTDAFGQAVGATGGVQTITLVPVADGTVSESLWRFSDFELRVHAEPAHGSAHIVDEFGSVTD